MNLDQLKYFEEICRSGSITKASEKLFISQQGLSMSMQRLEDHFSCSLFKRDSKGMTLSDDGVFLLSRVSIILEKLQECEDYFTNKATTEKTVKIGYTLAAASEFAAKLFHDFMVDYPQIHLGLKEYPEVMLDNAVEDGMVEIGLGLGPYGNGKFDSSLVLRRKHCLVVNKANPLAKLEKIPNEMLRGLKLVTCDESFKSTDVFMENCRVLKAIPDIRMKASDIYGVHRIISSVPDYAGLSLGSIAEAMPMKDVVAIPMEDERFDWCIYLIKNKGVKLSDSANTFMEYTKAKMKVEMS